MTFERGGSAADEINDATVVDLTNETPDLGAADHRFTTDGDVQGKPNIDQTIYLDPNGEDDPDPESDGTQSDPVSLLGARKMAFYFVNQVLRFDMATVTSPANYSPGVPIHFPFGVGAHPVAECQFYGDPTTPSNVTVDEAFNWGWGPRAEHGVVEGITFEEGVQFDGWVFVTDCVINPHTASGRVIGGKAPIVKVQDSTLGDGTSANMIRAGGQMQISFENCTIDGLQPEFDGGTGSIYSFDTGNTITRLGKNPAAAHDDEVRGMMGSDTGWLAILGGGTQRMAQAAAGGAGVYRPMVADLTGTEDFGGSVAANSVATVTITGVTGARADQNALALGPPSNFPDNLTADAVVKTDGEVTLKASNPTTSSVNVTAGNWNIGVFDMRESGPGVA